MQHVFLKATYWEMATRCAQFVIVKCVCFSSLGIMVYLDTYKGKKNTIGMIYLKSSIGYLR